MAIRPDRASAAAHEAARETTGDVDRPRTGANQDGAGSPMTTQQAVQEVSSMTDGEMRGAAGEWVPRLGLMDGLAADRAELIRGLYQIAAWVADHAELPVPFVACHIPTGDPAGSADLSAAIVERVAAALGVEPQPRAGGALLTAVRAFGPVEIRATAATLSRSTSRQEAAASAGEIGSRGDVASSSLSGACGRGSDLW